MAKRFYRKRNFRPESLLMIQRANTIIAEYQAAGYSITLRQLYYQFVSRDWLPNQQKEYKRLGDVINDARLAGLVDWDAMEDRGRYPRTNSHWSSPQDIVDSCARQFQFDKWADQPTRVEVWVEKDALIGIVEQVANEEDCLAFSCRGYTSATAIYIAARRILKRTIAGQSTVILHLGDHDPSGIDMTRDVTERIREMLVHDWHREVMKPKGLTAKTFDEVETDMESFGVSFSVKRIALTRAQIDQYNPPPNPAKDTDARFKSYRDEHGDESWELDALEPTVLADLIRDNIEALRDDVLWQGAQEREQEARDALAQVANRWEQTARFARWLNNGHNE